MKLLHEEKDRVLIRLEDGTILTVLEDAIQVKCIPGRRKTERKYMEYSDLYYVNDMFKKVYPRCECNGRVKKACD